jgi:hypothetical protein
MQTIYFANVQIPAAPLMLERRFYFTSAEQRQAFLEEAPACGFKVTGFGIEHLLTVAQAISECCREAASVDAPAS